MKRTLAALAFLAVVAGCHQPPHSEREYYRAGQRWRIHLTDGAEAPCSVILVVRSFEKPFLVGDAESDTCSGSTASERRIDLTLATDVEYLESDEERNRWVALELLGQVVSVGLLVLLASL